jgi:outer membrane autotransporter protein
LAETGVDTQIAGFGVARLPVSDRLNVLGRVGYHKTDFSGEVTDGVTPTDLDFSTDGIAYGAGVEYAVGQRTSVRADYTRYDFDGAEADAVSLAIARKF